MGPKRGNSFSRRRVRGLRDTAGVTLPELMIGLAVAGIAAAFSFGQFFQYQESVAASRAVRAIRADVAMTRSLAIRARAPVSLVATESQLRYVIRDTLGTLFHRRDFGSGVQLELTGLDVATTGDSLTFDARGILVTANPTVTATRRDKTRSVTFNALGRGQIN